jgi:hypothetical protein
MLVGLALFAGSPSAGAGGAYQDPEAFVREAFDGAPPEPSRLWLDPALKARVQEVLGRDLGVLRVRYWGRDRRTAWVLDEIGKEQPITTGVVVVDGEIVQIKVLVYRESRGFEVRYPFFTDQFRGARLREGLDLDREIDGISGATLSVRALTKLARLALLLHAHSEFAGLEPQ